MRRRSVRLGLDAPLEDRLTPSPAGDLDPAFGSGGVSTIQFLPPPQFFTFETPVAEDVALQPNGQAVLVGRVPSVANFDTDFGVTRLLVGGQPDPTFNAGLGTLRIPFDLGFTNEDGTQAVAIQGDGKIVVAGYASTSTSGKDFAVVRLNVDGSLDQTFGTKGLVTIPFTSGSSTFIDDVAYDVAVLADGKIVLAGSSRLDFAVARLNPDGTLDATFAGKGQTTIVVSAGGFNADEARAMTIQPDGKIVLAGSTDGVNFQYDFAVVRLNANGSVDGSFGNKGRAIIGFDLGGSKEDKVRGVAVQSGGQIVVVGSAEVAVGGFGASSTDMAIARLNPDGTPDQSFGTAGTQVVGFDLGGNLTDEARAVLVQPDDKIVVAGSAERLFGFSQGGSFVVMRMNADGTFDTDFGGGGKTVVPVGAGSFFFFGTDLPGANAVALQADGNIVSAGAGSSTFMAMRMLGAAPPPVPEPPVPPEPPSKQPILPTPLELLARIPDPILAGGAVNGTATVLFNQDGTFGPGTVLTFFPGAGGHGPHRGGRRQRRPGPRLHRRDRRRHDDPGGGHRRQGGGHPVLVPAVRGRLHRRRVRGRRRPQRRRQGRPGRDPGPGRRAGRRRVRLGEPAGRGAGRPAQMARFLGIDDAGLPRRGAGGPGRRQRRRHPGRDRECRVQRRAADLDPQRRGRRGRQPGAGQAHHGLLRVRAGAPQRRVRAGRRHRRRRVRRPGVRRRPGRRPAGAGGQRPGARWRPGRSAASTSRPARRRWRNFFAGDKNLRGGVRVQLRDVDGDRLADLTVGSGQGEPGRASVYAAASLTKVAPAVAGRRPSSAPTRWPTACTSGRARYPSVARSGSEPATARVAVLADFQAALCGRGSCRHESSVFPFGLTFSSFFAGAKTFSFSSGNWKASATRVM